MSSPDTAPGSGSTRWERYWFTPVPPHVFALLRILLAAVALLSLAGQTPVDTFWALDGLSPVPSNPNGPRAWLLARGLGAAAGWVFFGYSVVATVAMLVGFRSDAAVLATFLGLWLQTFWNRFPLSSAHQVALSLLFCLIWTETGRVWSLDARRRSSANPSAPPRLPIWPLRLVRAQVAIVYFSSALWKLLYPAWRDGTAVYWALNINVFHRFPWPLPVQFEPLLAILTWGTLLFEFFFPLLVWFRATRGPTLLVGIGLHLGLWMTLEIGPFSWVMMASYVAFLDPDRVAGLRWPTIQSSLVTALTKASKSLRSEPKLR